MDQGTAMLVDGNIVRRPTTLTPTGISSTLGNVPLDNPGGLYQATGSNLALVPSNSATLNIHAQGMFRDPAARASSVLGWRHNH